MLSVLAIGSDALHILAMLVWALGLPLLLWHRWPRLSFAYTLYAMAFVIVSQVSHYFLGECFLTTLSRFFWESAGEQATGTFMIRLVNTVAGVRPTRDSVVLVWEIAIVVTSAAVLWSLYRTHRAHASGNGPMEPQN